MAIQSTTFKVVIPVSIEDFITEFKSAKTDLFHPERVEVNLLEKKVDYAQVELRVPEYTPITLNLSENSLFYSTTVTAISGSKSPINQRSMSLIYGLMALPMFCCVLSALGSEEKDGMLTIVYVGTLFMGIFLFLLFAPSQNRQEKSSDDIMDTLELWLKHKFKAG